MQRLAESLRGVVVVDGKTLRVSAQPGAMTDCPCRVARMA
jgi:hypothetical protein